MTALALRNAFDAGTADEIAVKRDRTSGIVIARDRIGDARWVGVGVEDGNDRDAKPIGFLDRELFLVGVDDEDDIGRAAHILDATERLFKLVLLAGQCQELALGQAHAFL